MAACTPVISLCGCQGPLGKLVRRGNIGSLGITSGREVALPYPIGPADPIEAIKFRMEQQGLAAKDLEPFIGSSGRITALIVRLYADREPPLE